jgi:hypothetical protein
MSVDMNSDHRHSDLLKSLELLCAISREYWQPHRIGPSASETVHNRGCLLAAHLGLLCTSLNL